MNFRPISELSAHYNIQTEMDNLWQATKDAASSSGMNEKGFFIYVNTQNVNSYHSLVYQIVTVKNGPTVVCGETASIIPGTTSEVYPQNFMDGGIFAVAIFHTHPH